MPVAFADVHPFHKLGLADQPAILLGMDVLAHFDQVTIDFANRDVGFVLPGRSGSGRAGGARPLGRQSMWRMPIRR